MSKYIARPGGEAGPTSQQERGGMEVNGKTAFCQGKGGGEGEEGQIGGGRCMRRGCGLGSLLRIAVLFHFKSGRLENGGLASGEDLWIRPVFRQTEKNGARSSLAVTHQIKF